MHSASGKTLLEAVDAFAREPSRANVHELRRLKPIFLEALQSPAVPSSIGIGTAEGVELSELTGVDAATAAQLLAAASSQGMTSTTDRLKRAATLFYEARLERHKALHDLLQVFVSGGVPDESDGSSEADAFLNELMASTVEGASLLQCLAQRVGQAETRSRQAALQAGAVTGVGLHEVEVGGMLQAREALERNHVLLLAENAYFVAALCLSVSRDDMRALIAALTPLLPVLTAPSSARADTLAAHALFMACLTALERHKVRSEDVSGLLADDWFVAPDHKPARAALRLATALASTSGHEAIIGAACNDGCFACLLSVLHGQLRLPDFYAITAHSFLDSFIFDSRGRHQVKSMVDANQLALGNLLLAFAAVYATGPDDLPSASETLWMFIDFIAEELQRPEARSPAVLLGMLQLLDALSRMEPDSVWAHLHSRVGMVMVGDMVASAMLEYRNLCAGDDAQQQQQQRMFGLQATVRDVTLPADDISAMVAYLRVLQHIADVGGFTRARVNALQAKINQPLLHFWFTMLDLPVPPVLKAALFDLLGAFAADLVAALHIWALLEASAVIQKVPPEAFASAAPRIDISFQWNEVESREETYPETLAFIRLVTKLLALCGPTRTGPAAEGGAAAAHVFQFVRDTVFLGLDRRSYRDGAEKWRLAAACHAYFRCHFEVTQICCNQLRDVNLVASSPGAELLLDFNNEGPVMRRVVGAFAGGADRLEQDRFQAHSPDMVACILEGLELLVAAFDLDALATPTPGTVQQLARLDVLLLRDKRRTADLLSYVRCAEQPAVRTAAVRLLHAVAARNDRIAVALEPHIAARLKVDVADALERGLADAYAAGSQEALSSAGVAHTIQQLLLTSLLHSSVPGLAHLLLGFELPADSSVLALELAGSRSALSVLLRSVMLPQDASDWPPALVAQEHTYHILSMLASDKRTAIATVERIRATVPLTSVVEAVTQPFEQSSSAARTATQNWRAWVLRLIALTMFNRRDAARAGIVNSEAGMLRILFGGSAPCAVHLLHACQWRAEPAELPASVSRDLEELGIRMPSSSGDELYDVATWDIALRQHMEQRGQPSDPEFVNAILQHLVRMNDMRREDIAARGLLGAWSELLVLIFCQQADGLRAILQDAPETVIPDLLLMCLKLLPTADATRVPPLLRVVRAVLEHLHADVTSTQPLGALPLPPSSCHDVLRALLGVCMRSDRCEATRHLVCASVLALARMCRPPQWTVSPTVLHSTAINASTWADVGGNVRRELDAGMVAELRRLGGPLLAVLVRDALGATELGRVQSLVVLEALLSLADGAAAALESPLLLSGLPAAVATAVERTPRSVLMLPPRACEAALNGMCSQVSFLMAVARYAPAGATHLVGCGVVLRLAGCSVLDGLPEECTLGAFHVSAVLLPSLQLAGELLQLLPDSTDVFDQARRFVLTHQEAILRVTMARDANSDQRVALAAVRLLTALCSRDTGAELSRFREALERMCWHVFESSTSASGSLVMQAFLVVYIRRLVVAKRTILSLSGYGTTPAAARLGPPTLQLMMSLMKRQVASLGDLLRARFELIVTVAEIPPGGPGSVEHSMMVLDGNVATSRRPRSKTNTALDLMRVDTDVGLIVQALENALEAMHATLAEEMMPAKRQPQELETLRYDLVPVLDELARLQSEDCGRDVGFLRLVQRRLAQLLEAPAHAL